MPSANTIVVKLDPAMREQLDRYTGVNKLSTSQAVRLLLAAGLNGPNVFDAAAFAEGIRLGLSSIFKHIQSAIEEARAEVQ